MVLFAAGPTGDFTEDALILAEDLDRTALGIRSFREPLKDSVRNVVIPSIRKNFDSEGRPPWRELAPQTVIKRGSAHPILVRKGRLRKVATQLNIWSYTRDSATITGIDSRVHYGKYHQGGTSRMPQRAFIVLQNKDMDDIEDLFLLWIMQKMRKLGRFQ